MNHYEPKISIRAAAFRINSFIYFNNKGRASNLLSVPPVESRPGIFFRFAHSDQVTRMLASEWLTVVMWPGCWPLIGWEWSCDQDTGLWLAVTWQCTASPHSAPPASTLVESLRSCEQVVWVGNPDHDTKLQRWDRHCRTLPLCQYCRPRDRVTGDRLQALLLPLLSYQETSRHKKAKDLKISQGV